LKKANLNIGLLKEVKKLGFSDKQIGRCWSLSEDQVRELRNKLGILPVIKQIDTLAAEWPAKTNYLYLTYNGSYDDISFPKDGQTSAIIVLGAGPYRIGSSVEFDWATVNMVYGLRSNKIDNLAIINCNPETVSTDYDVPDRLYFEE